MCTTAQQLRLAPNGPWYVERSADGEHAVNTDGRVGPRRTARSATSEISISAVVVVVCLRRREDWLRCLSSDAAPTRESSCDSVDHITEPGSVLMVLVCVILRLIYAKRNLHIRTSGGRARTEISVSTALRLKQRCAASLSKINSRKQVETRLFRTQ